MTQKEYVSYDAMELAAAVHRGDVTATELLELALQRLEALNPQINAVVHLMEEDARSAATTPTNGLSTESPSSPKTCHRCMPDTPHRQEAGSCGITW